MCVEVDGPGVLEASTITSDVDVSRGGVDVMLEVVRVVDKDIFYVNERRRMSILRTPQGAPKNMAYRSTRQSPQRSYRRQT
jgi:hypothetical protein